jgi:tetratricopeptide (TPR) repeat protein
MQLLQALTDDVLIGRLSREDALARAAAAVEQAMGDDDRTIKQPGECIHTSAASKLERAAVLAMLNCQVARDWGGDIVWGTCNRTLAGLYMRQSELELALYHYRQALEAFESIPEARKAVVQLHLYIGRVYGRQGSIAAARAAYKTAKEAAESARTNATDINYLHLESDAWSRARAGDQPGDS